MPEIHQILIVPNLVEVAEEFARLLTPPFADHIENDRWQKSTYINIRMAYFNNDQIPIPRDTEASDVVAGLIYDAARTISVVGRKVPERFVGAERLWNESTTLSGENFSPFLVIEESNDCNVGVYNLNVAEIAPLLDHNAEGTAELIDILTREYENTGAVVITYSEEISQEQADWDAEIEAMIADSVNGEPDTQP